MNELLKYVYIYWYINFIYYLDLILPFNHSLEVLYINKKMKGNIMKYINHQRFFELMF